MKILVIFVALFMGLPNTFAGVLEERAMTGLDSLTHHQFILNPAFLGTTKKMTSFMAIKDTRESSVTGSPNNSNQQISYDYKNDVLAIAGLFPFGGGAAGLSYIQVNNQLDVDNSARGEVFRETKKDDIYAFRFVIQLTPQLDFGFHYQYKQAANHIFGSFFLGEDDKTNYKAFLSGYRLGFHYHTNLYGIGLYTAPAQRGKALIDGEQKIVTEPGTGGAEVVFKQSNKLNFGIGLTRWFYKKDDRLELSTSPVDQRNISLNGTDFDQYLFPIQSIRLGMRYMIKSNSFLLINVFSQESVFHFVEDSLPGDNREDIPSFRYQGIHALMQFSRNRYNIEGGVRLVPSRKQDSITDNTFKLGHRNYVNYKASERTFLLSLTFKN